MSPNEGEQIELSRALRDVLPDGHQHFLASLKSSYSCGDFFFVHAGVKPDVDLAHQAEIDLLWIRHEFLSSHRDFGKIIIHGHTPTPEIELRSNRINIDTGAFFTGRLTCLVIEGEALSVINTVSD